MGKSRGGGIFHFLRLLAVCGVIARGWGWREPVSLSALCTGNGAADKEPGLGSLTPGPASPTNLTGKRKPLNA